MAPIAALPLFDPYGGSPDDRVFDFIHVEAIGSRAVRSDWTIRAHRHSSLFQILLILRGGGEMTFDVATIAFEAPCAILVPSAVAHGFRFLHSVTEGWVLSFSEDVALALGDHRGEALAQVRALAEQPIVPLGDASERLSALAAQLHEERFLARPGFRIAMRGLTALVAVEVARLAAGRLRPAASPGEPDDQIVSALRTLIEENFPKDHQLAFYAGKLGMTVERLNDRIKRATGVTAGHLIRQRVLTEAKYELVFTGLAIHEIAGNLGFSDPSHFARFFRKQTGSAPHEFRAAQS